MATNEVIRGHSDGRLRILCAAAHTAGDLVFEKGFYGVVQDDVEAGAWATVILEGVWEFPRTPTTVAMGAKLHAPATAMATTLPLISAATNGQATAGWNPVGRTTATGSATAAKVRFFRDNAY
jgi:predicted RecA/RadA family phage recombinase